MVSILTTFLLYIFIYALCKPNLDFNICLQKILQKEKFILQK